MENNIDKLVESTVNLAQALDVKFLVENGLVEECDQQVDNSEDSESLSNTEYGDKWQYDNEKERTLLKYEKKETRENNFNERFVIKKRGGCCGHMFRK